MWVFTAEGFFSAVLSGKEPGSVTVRGRSREDIVHLARRLGAEVHETPERDYPFRIYVAREVWADHLKEAARAIDYHNFKNAVAKRQGWDRGDIYAEVWQVMRDRSESFREGKGAGG